MQRIKVLDNFEMTLVCEGDDALRLAMPLAFRGLSATHFAIWPDKGLVFFWADPQGQLPEGVAASAFPFRMKAAGAADFSICWLAEAVYPPEPDHDGDNSKGWCLYNEAWGHVGNSWAAIVAVKPRWAMHGK